MNGLSKFAGRILLTACGLVPLALHAQNQTVSGNLTVDDAFTAGASSSTAQLQFRLNGTIESTGSFVWTGGGLLSSDSSLSGPVFLWYPTKAALWAGYAASGDIQDSNIGYYSVALGYENSATAGYTVALGAGNDVTAQSAIGIGTNNTVSAQNAIVIGQASQATSLGAIAIGSYASASGTSSIAFDGGSAYGSYSTALCGLASGSYSFSAGYAYASGQYAAALGNGSATGNYSFAAGYTTNAGAPYACTVGNHSSTSIINCSVFGAYNLYHSASDFAWQPTDPLFEIGNGGDGNGNGNPTATGPSDALVVYKNGNATFQGAVTAAPGGDIPMFAGY